MSVAVENIKQKQGGTYIFFGIPSTVFLNHVNFALWAIRRNTFLVVTLGVGLGVRMKYCYQQQ